MSYARNTDPTTSHLAGEGARRRALSQHDILILTHYEHGHPRQLGFSDVIIGGLTDEEAGIKSGLREKPGCCYWKRCSELRQQGILTVVYIEEWDEVMTRMSQAGEQQQVCTLTEKGLERARTLLNQGYRHTPRENPSRALEERVDGAYLEWLEGVAAAAAVVAKFDGTERESLDGLRQALWNRGATG
jgi:hypothetical protein